MRLAVRLCCADSGTLLLRLADEFPAYEFGTQRTWNGVSLVAVRRDGADRAGTYAVITSDPGEMRHVLTLEADRAPLAKHETSMRRRNPGPSKGHHGQLPDGTR